MFKTLVLLSLILTAGCSQKVNNKAKGIVSNAIPTDVSSVKELQIGDLEITPSSSNVAEIEKSSGVVNLSFSVKNKSATPGKVKLSSNTKFLSYNVESHLTSCGIDAYKVLNSQQSCVITLSFNSFAKEAGFYSTTFDATDKFNGIIKSQDVSILVNSSGSSSFNPGDTCKIGYHLVNRACISNRQTCTDAGFSAGEKFWNVTSSSYGSCQAIQCSNNYKLFGSTGALSCVTCSAPNTHLANSSLTDNLCVSDTSVSSILNGSCTQLWQGSISSGSFGACQISCVSSQFTSDGVQCLRSNYAFATAKQKQAIGKYHSCFINTDNKLRCTGDNSFGQLGLGYTGGSVATLADNQFVDFSSFGAGLIPVDVAVTELSSCALLSDNSVKCWGRNNLGQLGIGTRIDSSLPKHVLLSTNSADMIRASQNLVCAKLKVSGKLTCWGKLTSGTAIPLGDVSPTSAMITESIFFTNFLALGNPLPEFIKKENGDAFVVDTISMGGQHLCLIESSSSNVYCNGTLFGSAVFNKFGYLAMPSGVVAMGVASGTNNMCIAGSNDAIYCQGLGSSGVLLNNTQGSAMVSTSGTTGVGCVAGSFGQPCGTITNNQLTYQGLGMTLTNLGIGANHACSTFTDSLNPSASVLKCWGANASYQLADQLGTKDYAGIGVDWGDVNTVKEVAFGGTTGDASCVVMNNTNDIKCFGASNYGEIPLQSKVSKQSFPETISKVANRSKFIPLNPSNGQTVIGLASNICAIDSADNFVKCIGNTKPNNQLASTDSNVLSANARAANAVGSYVAGDFSSSNKLDFGAPVLQIAGSNLRNTICAITNEATNNIKCIGDQAFGLIGNGVTTSGSMVTIPTAPTGFSSLTFKYITQTGEAGASTNSGFCAITTSGALYCWGTFGSALVVHATPVVVVATGVENVAINYASLCYKDTSSNLKCALLSNLYSGGFNLTGTNMVTILSTSMASLTFVSLASSDTKGLIIKGLTQLSLSPTSLKMTGSNTAYTLNSSSMALSSSPVVLGTHTPRDISGNLSLDNIHPNFLFAASTAPTGDGSAVPNICYITSDATKSSSDNSNVVCLNTPAMTLIDAASFSNNAYNASFFKDISVLNQGYLGYKYLPNINAKAIFNVKSNQYCFIMKDDSSLMCVIGQAATNMNSVTNPFVGLRPNYISNTGGSGTIGLYYYPLFKY